MLGMNEILNTEKEVATSRAVIMGVAGAIGGYLLANQLRLSTPMTVGAISLGHFAGHSADMYM